MEKFVIYVHDKSDNYKPSKVFKKMLKDEYKVDINNLLAAFNKYRDNYVSISIGKTNDVDTNCR